MELRRQLPNLLSGLRLALVPALLALAWSDHPTAFLCLFAFSLSTDVVDGFLARRWKAGSELGAKLDSWGDLATYAVFPLCAWWLFREKVVAQAGFVLAALFAFVVPTLVGLAKFRRVTSYHTRAAKAVAIVMGAGLLLFLGFDSPWLFQAAVVLLLVEAIEEIAITAVLPQWRANVPSIFSALRIARGAAPALALVLLGLPLGAAAGVTAELPDLRPEVSDVHLETNTTAAAGDVAEGCASATKGLDLLKLSLTTQNDGPADMNVGDPMCPLPCSEHPNETCGNPDFICSPAGGHNHPHYNNFLRYEVLDPNGVVAATGGKRSFCLEETACPGQIPRSGHTCENQGLERGLLRHLPVHARLPVRRRDRGPRRRVHAARHRRSARPFRRSVRSEQRDRAARRDRARAARGRGARGRRHCAQGREGPEAAHQGERGRGSRGLVERPDTVRCRSLRGGPRRRLPAGLRSSRLRLEALRKGDRSQGLPVQGRWQRLSTRARR